MTAMTPDEAMEHTILIAQTQRNFSAYSPDLLGCVATGATRDEAVREMRSAIAFHIEGLRKRRDALLPRLVSGELRVPEAERIVEASA